MSAITFGGLASGLPPDLVDRLMEAERMPIRNIEARREETENRLKLVQKLEDDLTNINKQVSLLAGAKGFTDFKLISGDPNIVQGVVDPGVATNGSWNVEVIQLARKAAVITNGFPDKDSTEIGVGYFHFENAGGSSEVYIDGDNNTLENVAQKINNANAGVRATVINDRKYKDYPYRLVISGTSVGDDNDIKFPTLYFLDGDQDLYFEEEREAQNGIVKVDGFEFEIADNTIKDFIPGVTIELKQEAPGRTINLSVKEDREAVIAKLKLFVDSMNGALSFIQSQSQIDGKTNTRRTLGGDMLIRNVANRLRELIQNPVYGIPGSVRRLNQVGIVFTRNGTLNFEEDKFNSVLARNPMDVQAFFAGDGFATGFVPKVRREIGSILNQGFGLIANRKRALSDKLSQADDQIANKERALSRKEEQLKNKFSKLEQTMSKLKSQGAGLAGLTGAGFSAPSFGPGSQAGGL